MNSPKCLLVNSNHEKQIADYISPHFEVVHCNKIKRIEILLRIHPVQCIIVYFNKDIDQVSHFFYKVHISFPHIPKLAIVDSIDPLQSGMKLGKLGFSKALTPYDYINLPQIIDETVKSGKSVVKLKHLGIVQEQYPKKLKTVLQIIEKHYLSIMSVKEICDYTNISEYHLPKLFKRYHLPTPNKLLLYFKVLHAVQLIKNSNLTLREISSLSGFTNESRFQYCFKRVFHATPLECKKKLNNESFDEFFENESINFKVKNPEN